MPRVFIGAGLWAYFVCHVPEFQIPRRNADVQHKTYCLHRHFRPSEPFLPDSGGNPPKSKFPEASQGLILQGRLFKDGHLELLC